MILDIMSREKISCFSCVFFFFFNFHFVKMPFWGCVNKMMNITRCALLWMLQFVGFNYGNALLRVWAKPKKKNKFLMYLNESEMKNKLKPFHKLYCSGAELNCRLIIMVYADICSSYVIFGNKFQLFICICIQWTDIHLLAIVFQLFSL